MTLRNLNQRKPRGRILGTPKTGVLGALIPSTGVNGPGYAYPSLSLPADAAKEICGYITTWPTADSFDASENTGFTLSSALDGVYPFQFQLQADGVDVGTPRTATVTQSTPGVTISCLAGNAVAGGLNATITAAGQTTINCQVGTASAACPSATIAASGPTSIACAVGNASAACPVAFITNTGTPLTCSVEFRHFRSKPMRALRLA